ncbi:hypothetical protein GW17_00002429 [Ensete ventricosum]|nr:hypothetical protein GW17_00002429 [Ensete ventricosum]
MIDTESSADILYLDTFQKLGVTNEDLTPMTSTLTGFTGDAIAPIGVVTLLMTFGQELRTKTLMVSFMVVELLATYNVIIGRPTLNKLMTVVSTCHRSMKFLTSVGTRKVKINPRESRRCYLVERPSPKKARGKLWFLILGSPAGQTFDSSPLS